MPEHLRAACATARQALRPARFTAFALTALALSAVVATPAAARAAPAPTPAAVAGGAIGIRLVDAPATARDDPRAQIYIVDHLAPGTVIHREIEIANTTAATTHITLYPAAATIVEGEFLGAVARTANELSTWTSLTPDATDMISGGRMRATVTISVPSDAAPGEQYGVIWAEAPSGPAADNRITQVSRVGIRIYLSVGPGGPPAADFTIDSMTAARSSDGQPMVVASVHNIGGRALDLNGTLHLKDGPGGLRAGPFPASLGVTLAIGATAPVTIALDKQLPAGPWDAQITLRSGLVERSERATISFPDSGTALSVNTTTARPDSRYPTVGGLIALLLLGVAGIAVLHRRRVRPSRPSATAVAVTAARRR